MANLKTGMLYYNVDTDRFMDVKIRRLKKDMGCDGFAVYEYLLNEIYRFFMQKLLAFQKKGVYLR